MVDKGIDDLIDKYSRDEAPPWAGRVYTMTAKISASAKLKLEYLSQHVGVKKTPLIGEIAEAAINDLFDRLYDEMPDEAKAEYTSDLQNMEENL